MRTSTIMSHDSWLLGREKKRLGACGKSLPKSSGFFAMFVRKKKDTFYYVISSTLDVLHSFFFSFSFSAFNKMFESSKSLVQIGYLSVLWPVIWCFLFLIWSLFILVLFFPLADSRTFPGPFVVVDISRKSEVYGNLFAHYWNLLNIQIDASYHDHVLSSVSWVIYRMDCPL